MGVYRAAIVTESGQNLIAQALANETPLIFTSAKTSSYSYPVGTNVPALTGLQDVVQSVMPFDSKVLGGNVAQVSVRFDNDGVDQTYRIETIGLYAKIEGGTETLFSVTQATTPDEMPVQSDVSPSAYIYNIQHTVQNASQITLTVNPVGTATVQDIMDIESPEFDDSGTVEGISSFPSFLETMKSKMNFFQFFRNLKAGLQFVLHAGQIVNNCVTDNAGLPLSAAQGKVLKDLIDTTNNNLSNFTVMRNASGVNQFKAVDQNGNNGMLFKVKDNSEFSVNVWKDNAFGNEKILATKDDLNTVLMYRGVITGDLNRGRNLEIAPGIYNIQSVSTVTNGPSDFIGWGIFVQFPDNLFSQMILNSPNYIKFRKYSGSNPSWSAW